MQNMPLCMQNTPAICANEVIGSSAGLVLINAHGTVHFPGAHLILELWRYADFPVVIS